jgi:hypothetical protein
MRNARNAAIGYVAYAIARRVVRRKTRNVLRRLAGAQPHRSRRPLVGAAALAATATAGAVMLHRRRPHGA